MATFGIEGIRYFDKLRAAGYAASDLRYVFNVCNGLLRKLESRGHTKTFYYANDDCWETDIRSSFQGGGDNDYADNVDLFFIYTHGNHDSKGNIQLGYNVKKDKWLSNSAEWCLGEHQVEWVMAYACSTVDLEQFGTLYNIFQGLHGYCGAWGEMIDGSTVDEVGEDVGENLINGDPVSHAWIDGVSDWWVDNHPIVITAETENTPSDTTMDRDRLVGHGFSEADIYDPDSLCAVWAEG